MMQWEEMPMASILHKRWVGAHYPARACAARGYVIGRGVYIYNIYIL